jgi:serine/threonine protein kinase
MARKIQFRYLNFPPFKGKIHVDYDNPSLISQLVLWAKGENSSDFEVIHSGRNVIGKISLSAEKDIKTDLIIKKFRLKGVNRVKSVFLPSKARRAWEGALALWKQELNTPKPVAFLERPEFPGIKEGFFITESLEDFEEIRYLLRNLEGIELKNLVRSLAEYVSLCHARGILHRDFSDGNILTKKNENGDHIFYLIDTNRIRAKAGLSRLKRIKSLIRLGIPEGLQLFFLEVYSGKKPVARIWWLWYRWNKRKFEMYLRLKKLLRVKKLAEALRIQ